MQIQSDTRLARIPKSAISLVQTAQPPYRVYVAVHGHWRRLHAQMDFSANRWRYFLEVAGHRMEVTRADVERYAAEHRLFLIHEAHVATTPLPELALAA